MRGISAVVGLVVLLAAATAAHDAEPASPSLLQATLSRLPIYFIENRGVYPDEVAYYVQGANKTLFFTKDGITFRLKGKDRAWVVKLEFVGANPDAKPRGEDQQQAVFSYFKGPEKDWKTGLETYAKVVYEELWPGIDLVYHGTVNRLKYEFVVKPGADPGQIRLRYRGVESLERTASGALSVKTPAGGFEDAAPESWQEVEGTRVAVAMEYRLNVGEACDPPSARDENGHSFSFRVGDYDHTKPLVLDPVILVYCGYIGGSGTEFGGLSIAVDAGGNAYVTGWTQSSEQTFPVKVGPDLTFNAARAWWSDAFVAKVNAQGTALVYCGYIGGSGHDEGGRAIAVDAGGNAYVTGTTTSDQQTFPVRIGPDLTHNGGTDAFVAKVNASGTGLAYCGYIGGDNRDQGEGIAVDGAGNAYVTGFTSSTSTTFPVKVGPYLTGSGGFVCKVSASGSGFVYSGFIPATSCRAVAVDPKGNAYVTGYAYAGLPVKVGPDLTHNGLDDAFVAKVSSSGTELLYSGFIGGNTYDYGLGIAVDEAGNAYVTGGTTSHQNTFPLLVGPNLIRPGGGDAFVAKVTTSGRGLVYCGYIGGTGGDDGVAIAVDRAGNAYVTGLTSSSEQSFPVLLGPDMTYNGGMCDGFVSKVNAAGTGLVYCGYVGGSGDDSGQGIAVDRAGNAYVTGWATSNEQTFPVTVGPDVTHAGGWDAFVAKVATTFLVGSGSPAPGGQVNLSLSSAGDAGLAYQIGSSFGFGPIQIDTRPLHLSPDSLFIVTVNNYWPRVFSGYRGVIDSKGQAQAAIHIPNIPALIGVRLQSAFVTLASSAPSGIKSISNTFTFSIAK